MMKMKFTTKTLNMFIDVIIIRLCMSIYDPTSHLKLLPQNTVCVMSSWLQSPVSSLLPHGIMFIL